MRIFHLNRFQLKLLAFIVVACIVACPLIVSAQTDQDAFDSAHGWGTFSVLGFGSYSGGQWTSTCDSSGSTSHFVRIAADLTFTTTITQMTLVYSSPGIGLSSDGTAIFYIDSGAYYSQTFVTGNHLSYTVSVSIPAGTHNFRLVSFADAGQGCSSGYSSSIEGFYVNRDAPTATPSPSPTATPIFTVTPSPATTHIAYPISSADRLGGLTIGSVLNPVLSNDITDISTHAAFVDSGKSVVFVHAVVAGQVVGVENVTSNPSLNPCSVLGCPLDTIDDSHLYPPATMTLGLSGSNENPLSSGHPDRLWIVVIHTSSDEYFAELVAVPKVSSGQQVSEGCILGESVPTYFAGLDGWPLNISQLVNSYTIVYAVKGDTTIIDTVPLMADDPQDISCSGTPPAPQGGCIVLNPDLGSVTDETSAWIKSDSDVQYENGGVNITGLQYIYQRLTLYPAENGPQDYTVNITASASEIDITALEVNWVPLDGVPGVDSSGSGPGSGNVIYTDTPSTQNGLTITITQPTTYALVIKASNVTEAALITNVCIVTTNGSPPPGYGSGDMTTPYCAVGTYAPVGDLLVDTPALIQFVIFNMNQLWYCQAKTILFNIWALFVTLLTFLGFMRVFMSMSVTGFATWLNADIVIIANYANGMILNMTSDLRDSILYGTHGISIVGGGGVSILDVIISFFNTIQSGFNAIQNVINSLGTTIQSGFGTISTLFNQLGSVINNIITTLGSILNNVIAAIVTLGTDIFQFLVLAITLIGSIVTLIVTAIITWINGAIALIGIFLSAIVSAMNAPAIAPLGIPICDTSASMIPANCLGIFTLDNTIFADGGLLATFIPLVEGAVGFGLLWWGINKFKRTIEGTG